MEVSLCTRCLFWKK